MLETRTVIISGEINDEVARDVANKLLLLEATSNDQLIYLYQHKVDMLIQDFTLGI